MDRRIVRTRKALKEALIRLSLEGDFEKLTIKAVTAEAGISYVTFFRHYKSLDDVVEELFTNAAKIMVHYVAEHDSLGDITLGLWKFVDENQSLFRMYVSLPPEHQARVILCEELEKLMRARYRKREASPVPLAVSMTHIIESSYQLLLEYLERTDEYRPEQMAAIQRDLVIRPTESTAVSLREEWLRQHPTYR